MDPIDMLIDGAIQHEVLLNKNPYLTMETMILRLYKKISMRTGVTYNQCDKTILFSEWHDEILNAYHSIKSKVNQEEKAVIERVLSKDCPYPSELIKFACCWYKHDPERVNRWFAVDGIVGTHPKVYVQDAFSTKFEKHNSAVRTLYDYYTDPETIKIIVSKALAIPQEDNNYDGQTELDTCTGIYAEMVGEEEMERVALDRKSKLQAQQQPKQSNKRSKKQISEHPEKSDVDKETLPFNNNKKSSSTEESVDKKKSSIVRHPIKRKIGEKTREPVKREKTSLSAEPVYSPRNYESPPFSPCYSPHSPEDCYDSSPIQSPQE